MVSIDLTAAPARSSDTTAFYRAAWRWHFYAGLYVIPFFAILALTGMTMLWIAFLGGRDGERIPVVPQDAPLAVSIQADAALAAVYDSVLVQYVAPRAADRAAVFRVDVDNMATMVAVDPYTAQVLQTWPRRSGWYDLADNIHSELLLGVTGDRMLEIAASLGMVLIATGLYMWWPRDGGWRRALVPSFKGGRSAWKSLHGAIGLWISVVLVFFLLSGLSWSGVWGEKMVQAWSQFPAEKWDNVPLSDKTHGSMNHGPKEVPWALEQTPMPASGSTAGTPAAQASPDIDSIDALARQIGFEGRYQMNLPSGANGVWTLARDSMNNDSVSPTADRTTHIDRFTGNILADVRYDDYSLAGKAMAVGIALHMGTLGIWSVLANTLFCLCVLTLCLTSVVMWWKRRAGNGLRLAAPPLPRDMPLWQGAVVVGLAVSLAFPMAGLTLLAVLALDALVIRRIAPLKRLLS
ncbi:PepSY-associated TM helix domain-containing protein [Pseudosulfitobacter pseudonitzschiae]|uniref:PepSY-associated TM helix domain-containing protein n=1 Tax=Pseudosulfitobacter pseudonitzschiae TaxID=1402135 RepID=UPI001AF086BC|nr:PepSY domain-containing protein [Pseudosulfitobacter pseudonitzschiae]MBM1816554.1 PepSY domain-containing protein [Pseudosulfitobacter pseudonitzschiae]MBM1833152.1 PepSY domain-containing protein [Pseudosulfitobacter pseudonitzschiae]MBM1838020.1 PepSY domain-containing protein [Pseudosulfitobacter pseudonitzschiae]MBM1843281.1 PepSY domain-containing protein [Pseudosulfitobacter pseudonitzschiae]MBM1848147.1 PepSY domain-containing protein [Pseudosulfitobacter pseudonitzschiae]